MDLCCIVLFHFGSLVLKVHKGNGVIEYIVDPADAMGGLDGQAGGSYLDLMTFQGADQKSVSAQRYWNLVTIMRAMFYAEAHDRIMVQMRLENPVPYSWFRHVEP